MQYRNVVSVVSLQGIEIDAGSLWTFDKNLNLLILVDEDEYITHKPSNDIFEKV
ncbi:hypothetical protein [Faecalibacter sp. LW9]|uniref:hypothetical protein n=1 Tax=Faecalibacter sp. LW9 TaxID=3103144 RepID=UPI002AFE4D99|nr:hypothetical protein [Faecalibacter sp. LW9]